MKVPLIDLRAQHEKLGAALLDTVTRIIESGQFVLGPEVEALEQEISDYCQTQYAVGCASGSDALLLALMALNLKSGDEVITTPFTFFATGAAISRVGATPVFVDIDPRTYNIDPEQVEAAVSHRTRAILPVHLYGQCADMDALIRIGARNNIPIVEDAAQAIGAEDRERRAGSMGQIGCFSFYPTKNLGGAGDGGMLVTNDANLYQRLRKLRVHGGATEFVHDEIGINSRLDALQASILRVKLRHLDEWTEAKQKQAALYTSLLQEAYLADTFIPPVVRSTGRHIFHQYVVRASRHESKDVIKHLAEHGISSKVYYPVPLHLQECFAYLGYRQGQLPNAELAANHTFALPCYPELTLDQQRYVIAVLGKLGPA